MVRNRRINKRLTGISKRRGINKTPANRYTGKGTLTRGEYYGSDWGDKRNYALESTGKAKYRNLVTNVDDLKMKKTNYPDGTVRRQWLPTNKPIKK